MNIVISASLYKYTKLFTDNSDRLQSCNILIRTCNLAMILDYTEIESLYLVSNYMWNGISEKECSFQKFIFCTNLMQ